MGAVLGATRYFDLTEGPFVTGDTSFEQPGFNGSDCYWSPEAAQVDDRLTEIFLLLPVASMLLMASGFSFAVWRRSTTPSAGPARQVRVWAETALAAVALTLISAVSVGFAHGFSIGDKLDAGCVQARVPGLALTVIAELAAAVAAVAVGFWLGGHRAQPRRASQN